MAESDQGLLYEEFLRCQICGEVPAAAKLLTCLHSYCLSCLYKKYGEITGGTKSSQEDIRCPKCDSLTTLPPKGVVGLRDNVFLQRTGKCGFTQVPPWCVSKSCYCEAESKNNSNSNDIIGKAYTYTIDCEQCGVNKGAESRGDNFVPSVTNGDSLSDPEDDAADPEQANSAKYHCSSCDIYICDTCLQCQHQHHQVLDIPEARADKQKYLGQLLDDLTVINGRYDTQTLQLTNALNHLQVSTTAVIKEIEERAQKICQLIQERKQKLVSQITLLRTKWEDKYSKQQKDLLQKQTMLNKTKNLTRFFLNNAADKDIIDMTPDLAGRLHHLSNGVFATEKKNSNKAMPHGVAVFNVRLDVPDTAKDDLMWDKAFGSLVSGTIHCGSADVTHTFDIDLTWPTGMTKTKDHNFVVVGKTGALEQQGKVMYYNRHGQLLTSHDLGNLVPFDTVSLPNGDVLVSESSGSIRLFSQFGDLKDKMKSKFKGTGRMAVNQQGHILVTTSDDKKVLVYDISGKLKDSFPGPWTEQQDPHLCHPHYIAVNRQGETVVSDFKQNIVFVFDQAGDLLRTYNGVNLEGGQLKCASAVCCDNFDNILVADFMNDCVHLVSRHGNFLGYLVTSDNGISCPNFMTVDNDGNLFIGQYGGTITVFQYLSFMRLV